MTNFKAAISRYYRDQIAATTKDFLGFKTWSKA